MLNTTSVYAANTKSLFLLYDIDYVPTYPQDITDTIESYENAKRYAFMYQYITKIPDKSPVIEKRLEEVDAQLAKVKDKLKNCYFLPMDEITALEEEYTELNDKHNDYTNALHLYTVDNSDYDFSNVPTAKEYYKAVELKKYYSGEHTIGELLVKYPTDEKPTKVTKNANEVVLTIPETKVKSMYSGRVTNTNNNSVTISHFDGVYTYYGNLKDINVKVGDAVSQYTPIGTAEGDLTLRLKVANKIVDISKIFYEDQ